MTDYIGKGAIVSADGKYRYHLWREWRNYPGEALWDMWNDEKGKPIVDGAGSQLGEPKRCLFIMLNPSTADGETDDPTIRRCVGFARKWKYDRVEVVNLFAYRATSPKALLALNHDDDPVGWQNEEHVVKAVDHAHLIVCAWGAHGRHIGQDETLLGWIGGRRRYALGLTKDGSPVHPLYQPLDATLREFRP